MGESGSMKDLIHIKKLFRYLVKEEDRVDDISIDLKSSRSVLLSEYDFRKDHTGATIIWKKNGIITVQTSSWNESHHNGDPYNINDKCIPLIPPFDDEFENFGDGEYGEGTTIQKAITAIEMDLESQAMEKAQQEYNERKQKEEEGLVRDFLYSKLGY